MAPLAPAGRVGLSRRGFLTASAAGLAVLALGGCTGAAEPQQEPVTAAQADGLVDQVAVQAAVVAAYAATASADPALAGAVAELAAQAGAQLERLLAAAPDAPSAPPAPTPSPGADPKAWLAEQVLAAADSHAAACLAQSGGRAALLGSITAGLRGQAVALA